MTKTSRHPDDIKTALSDSSLPEPGTPKYALEADVYDSETETTTTHEIWPGDVLERHPPNSTVSEYWVVIDLSDDDVIYYVPDAHRFGSYPITFLEEDLSNRTVAYHKQIVD